MEAYMWLILASMLGVGIVFGFFMGRSKGDTSAPKVLKLEQEIKDAKEEIQSYKGEVTQHFEKTATLVNQLTNSYRDVYEHLASSSEKLCGGQVPKLASLAEETKVLEGQGEQVAPSETKSTPEAASESVKETTEQELANTEAKKETAEVEASSEPEEKQAAETEEKKGNGSSQEAAIKVSETTAGDKQAEETRTIH